MQAAAKSLYLPSLDGLRFLAFIVVFFHHMPAPNIPILRQLHEFGWAGVELFFVISAFLFFHLLKAEAAMAGTISIPNFYLRRGLRIYPLMTFYPIAVILFVAIATTDHIDWSGMLVQFVALMGMAQNFLTWITGYSMAIPWTAHLWTLSFELQIYLIIPFAFIAFLRIGRRAFILALAAAWLGAIALRSIFIYFHAAHPVIWVTPFLRPESILVGLLLAIGAFRSTKTATVVVVAVAAMAMLIRGRNVQDIGLWTLAIYPLVAIIAGCILWLATNLPAVSAVLSVRPLRFLGKISYGLYVFHVIGIHCALLGAEKLGIRPAGMLHYSFVFGWALALTLAMAAASYYLLERRFLYIKERFSKVVSRLP